mgnify:CR=1 FL=1
MANNDLSMLAAWAVAALAALALAQPLPIAVVFGEKSPDIDGDLDVDARDQGLLLGMWTPRGMGANSPADLNGDGTVNGIDLGILLGAWSGPGVLWQPYTVEAADRMSGPAVPITIPAGSRVTDAETIGGPLWRGVRAFTLPRDDPHAPLVVVYELPEGWIPEDRIRVTTLTGESK